MFLCHPISQKDVPSNVSQVRTRSTTKKLRHCLENQTKDNIIFDLFVMVMKVNANKHCRKLKRMMGQFQEHV